MKKVLYLVALPILGIILYYVFGTNSKNYAQTIDNKRKERIHFLTNSSGSPVENKTNFHHPGFFETQKKYRITAKIDINPKTQQFAIPFSTGKAETYIHYGDVKFTIDGKKQQLILFQHLENPTDFIIPFGDLSNGKETYEAGRYLPIQYGGGEHIVLDFNLAENPYCAFNEGFSCPLPPKENILAVEVLAGEKPMNH